MSTRALHLEVVSDMSTHAFLAAFRWFVVRRGHCAKLFSYNGTTFVGWQFVQRMLQSFWRRWSQEYLSNLMRYELSSKIQEPKVGDVVLIKEDNFAPSRWLMGRILEKHPGDDKVKHVVTLRIKSSIIKRPTSKLCI
ncbi:unnamed protein product [Euphydryas editha]|uniref:DUF5641 domain-containing protein n=1 Tax=Euphydryas editha TaxID=104508 RepID=A0AAU9TIU6_EUPED|nr:unnamed protein product [Euphydryas editha]